MYKKIFLILFLWASILYIGEDAGQMIAGTRVELSGFNGFSVVSDIRTYILDQRYGAFKPNRVDYKTEVGYINQESRTKKSRTSKLNQTTDEGAEKSAVNVQTQGRNMRSVWDIPTRPSSIPHFAMYPEALAERMIKSGCPIGGTVLDPFMGAGNTLTTARKLGRDVMGIEIYDKYFKIAEARINAVPEKLFKEDK